MLRRFVLIGLGFVAPAVAQAQPLSLRPAVPLSEAPRRYSEILDELEARRRREIRPMNITREGPSEFGYVPAVGNTPGAFGSYFTSDAFFVNPHSDGYVTVDIYYLPNGQDNVAVNPLSGRFRFEANTGYFQSDIVGQIFHAAGVGALFFATVPTASTTINPTISAWAYTSTPGPTGGRYGSNVHGIGEVWSDSLFDGWCVGARSDSTARTNAGILNRGTTPLTVSVEITSPAGTYTQTVTVPPAGVVQAPITAPFQYSSALVFFDSLTSNTGWVSYIAVADNITNDFNLQYSTGW
jgi:hypothetical protein